jgi:hypothetical protein
MNGITHRLVLAVAVVAASALASTGAAAQDSCRLGAGGLAYQACCAGKHITLNDREIAREIIFFDRDQNPIAVDDRLITAAIEIDGVEGESTRIDLAYIGSGGGGGAGKVDSCSERQLERAQPTAAYSWIDVQSLIRATDAFRAFHLERTTLRTVDRTSQEAARERGIPLFIRERSTISDRVLELTDGETRLHVLPLADFARALGIEDMNRIKPDDRFEKVFLDLSGAADRCTLCSYEKVTITR